MWVFMLFLIVGSLLFVFAYVFAISNDEPKSPTPADPKLTPEPPKPTPPQPTPPQKVEQKYVSIYEYTPCQSMKRCAHCDGENTYDARVCQICGNDIDS